jgi:glutamate 5-kinase
MNRQRYLKGVNRLVIKIGSALMARGPSFAESIARQVIALRAQGIEIIVVSSGAIALGLSVLGYAKRPTAVSKLQAAASAGQFELMRLWHEAFNKTPVAQVLLTHADLANRERFLNARHALSEILACGVVPIVNENDAVATDEIRLGDNDNLGAQVASLLHADLLVILTTVDGLHSGNPEEDINAKRVGLVEKPASVKSFAKGASKVGLSVGGMHTKIEAATSATQRGIPVVICKGEVTLQRILQGDDVGTLFTPATRIKSRKHWIGFTLRPKGKLHIDAGAEKALLVGKKSLLPSGLTKVTGAFARGAMVEIVGSNGELLARGLAAYSGEEMRQLAGCNTRDILKILGYMDTPEIVHRDDMLIVESA